MAIKSYIRGFGAYPVDTRNMISATDTFFEQASGYALANDSVSITLSSIHFEWKYFGSQVYCVLLYDVP